MPPSPDDILGLTLLPEVRARRLLSDRRLRLLLVTPPYPSLGTGTLRVLRVRDDGDGAEVTAGYERYERLEGP